MQLDQLLGGANDIQISQKSPDGAQETVKIKQSTPKPQDVAQANLITQAMAGGGQLPVPEPQPQGQSLGALMAGNAAKGQKAGVNGSLNPAVQPGVADEEPLITDQLGMSIQAIEELHRPTTEIDINGEDPAEIDSELQRQRQFIEEKFALQQALEEQAHQANLEARQRVLQAGREDLARELGSLEVSYRDQMQRLNDRHQEVYDVTFDLLRQGWQNRVLTPEAAAEYLRILNGINVAAMNNTTELTNGFIEGRPDTLEFLRSQLDSLPERSSPSFSDVVTAADTASDTLQSPEERRAQQLELEQLEGDVEEQRLTNIGSRRGLKTQREDRALSRQEAVARILESQQRAENLGAQTQQIRQEFGDRRGLGGFLDNDDARSDMTAVFGEHGIEEGVFGFPLARNEALRVYRRNEQFLASDMIDHALRSSKKQDGSIDLVNRFPDALNVLDEAVDQVRQELGDEFSSKTPGEIMQLALDKLDEEG